MITFLKGYLEVPEDEAVKSYEFLVSHMPDNMIVDDSVIKSAMEFAASALKLKPDAVPDILRFATGRMPAPLQNDSTRSDRRAIYMKIRVAFVIGQYPPEERNLREQVALSYATPEIEIGILSTPASPYIRGMSPTDIQMLRRCLSKRFAKRNARVMTR